MVRRLAVLYTQSWVGVDKYCSGHHSSVKNHFSHCRTTTVTAVRHKAVVTRMELSTRRQHLYSEVVYTLQIRSLPKPPVVDFISQDNNNLISTHYLKCLDSLILFRVPEQCCRLLCTPPQHCSGDRINRKSIYQTHPLQPVDPSSFGYTDQLLPLWEFYYINLFVSVFIVFFTRATLC